MTDASSIGLAVAFAAGVISFLSPCVLPLVPAYVSYVAGASLQRRRRLHARERLMALGMSAPFLLTALFIDRATRLLGGLRGFGAALQIGGGLVLVALGIAMLTGWLTVFANWLLRGFPALGAIG